jgi:hypothetical protein
MADVTKLAFVSCNLDFLFQKGFAIFEWVGVINTSSEKRKKKKMKFFRPRLINFVQKFVVIIHFLNNVSMSLVLQITCL